MFVLLLYDYYIYNKKFTLKDNSIKKLKREINYQTIIESIKMIYDDICKNTKCKEYKISNYCYDESLIRPEYIEYIKYKEYLKSLDFV